MFSIQSQEDSETLTLNMENLFHMQEEFNDCYNDLFDYSSIRLKHCLKTKLEAMDKCDKIQKEYLEKVKEYEKNQNE
jgi:hypothetical protein